MRSVIITEFERGVREGNRAEIARFFKLFPLLKMAQEGLARYAEYLASNIDTLANARFSEIRIVPGGKCDRF